MISGPFGILRRNLVCINSQICSKKKKQICLSYSIVGHFLGNDMREVSGAKSDEVCYGREEVKNAILRVTYFLNNS